MSLRVATRRNGPQMPSSLLTIYHRSFAELDVMGRSVAATLGSERKKWRNAETAPAPELGPVLVDRG
jgi:hypothetical protein